MADETREEYIAWCAKRAMEYHARGEFSLAVTSMVSDMNKRDDTKVAPTLATVGVMYAAYHDGSGVKRFVEGFR